MDCRTARLLLEFQRPCAGELPADDEAELKDHLGSCPECGAASSTERRLDDYFGRAVREVSVPDNLRERLLGRLKEERSAALRRKLAWTARGVAVAATLLIGVFAWWYWIGSKPPHLDYASMVEADAIKYGREADGVQEWFRDHRQVTMVAPKQFDYRYLADYDLAPLQGKSVPKLEFKNSEGAGTSARVYVVTTDQFDLETLRQDLANAPVKADKPPVIESLGRELMLQESDEAPGTFYVIILQGDDLQPLKLPPPDLK